MKLQPHDGEDDRSYRLRDSLAVARISGRDVTFVSTQTGASRTIAMQSVDAHVIAHLAASKDKTVSLRSLAIGLAAVLVSDLRAALKRLTRAGVLV